jgi:uncharacterized damage-inducible protein DinB
MGVKNCRELADFSLAVRESTTKSLKRVAPGMENWRVDEDAMSFADTGHHILEADQWLFRMLKEKNLQPMRGRPHAFEVSDRSQYDSLISELKRAGEFRRDLIAGMSSEDLAEMIYDERFDGEVSAWWIIVRGNLDHEIHHRGQIIAYLRMARGDRRSR